jgi:hypothetical protein
MTTTAWQMRSGVEAVTARTLCARIVQSRVWIPCMVGMFLFHDVILLVIKLKRWGGPSLHDLGLMQGRRLSALTGAGKISETMWNINEYWSLFLSRVKKKCQITSCYLRAQKDGTWTCHVRSLWRHSLPCSYTASRADNSAAISSPTETAEFAFWQVINNSKRCTIRTWN